MESRSFFNKIATYASKEGAAISGTYLRIVKPIFGKHTNGSNNFELDVRDVENDEVNLVTMFHNASLYLLHTTPYGCIRMISPTETHWLPCRPPATVSSCYVMREGTLR